MWYEAMPSAIIIAALFYIGQKSGPILTNAMFGNPFRRETDYNWQRSMIARDTRISGAVWITPGLENIPDPK